MTTPWTVSLGDVALERPRAGGVFDRASSRRHIWRRRYDAFPFNAYYEEALAPVIDGAGYRLELSG